MLDSRHIASEPGARNVDMEWDRSFPDEVLELVG